ncbi:MAG: ATP synthase F1 subunit delta [Candidatus Krumholzibacteriia bacterium]
MLLRGVANRYSTALFNAALDAGVAGEVRDELLGFKDVLSASPEFRSFLLSPQVLTEHKRDIVNSTIGKKGSPLFARFVLLLLDKKRFFFIDEIADSYIEIYERHEGILKVEVVTAVPLDASMEKKVVAKLEKETGKKIRITPVTDPEIIGGMILMMEDKIIDGSIRFQLEKLRRDLGAIRVA